MLITLKLDRYGVPRIGERFCITIRGRERLVEIVEIVGRQDRGLTQQSVYTVKCAIIADVLQ